MANVIEITDFTAPELDVYARLSEGQLLNRAEPEKGMFIADMRFIINMFGFGMVVHMLVSLVMWKRYGRKQTIRTGKTTLA